jgi:uncharacterized protein with gpF-like domain
MDPIETTADPTSPEEAIEFFRRKVLLTDEEFQALSDKNHRKAFTLAGVADIDVIQDVFDSLDTALEQGIDFRDWKQTIGETLSDAWGGTVANPGFRLETIFRTNLQSSYAAGRYEQAKATREDRPYMMLLDVPDKDQCEDCAAISEAIGGKAIPFDEWDDELPPYHCNCRDTVITLTEDEAVAQGVLEEMPDLDDHIDDGFMGPPDDYEPDAKEYDDELEPEVARFSDAGE